MPDIMIACYISLMRNYLSYKSVTPVTLVIVLKIVNVCHVTENLLIILSTLFLVI